MTISIAGAGIAGLAAAIALNNAGLKVTVFETATRLEAVGAGLGLAPNAIAALEKLGLAQKVVPLGHELKAFHITDRFGKLLSGTDSERIRKQYSINNFTIHRAQLHRVLLEELKGVSIFTGKALQRITTDHNKVQLQFSDGTIHESDYLLAADGINSVTRAHVLPQTVKRYAGYTCWRGVVSTPDIDLDIATEIWDKKGRLGIVPLKNSQMYWFACVNAPKNDPGFRRFTSQDLSRYFGDLHPLGQRIIGATPDRDLLHNDIYDISPLAQYSYGRILLIGDAAHAATPNMAQGACQALEDAAMLASLLKQEVKLENVFNMFEQQRLSKTHYIINQSRRIGQLAQLDNPLLIAIRNFLLPLMPASMQQKQMELLYRTAF